MGVSAMAEQLTATDRCDRCGAQAYAISLHGTSRLYWCAHHLREHEDKVTPFLIHDQTHRLQEPQPA